jgi:hypothetical protein
MCDGISQLVNDVRVRDCVMGWRLRGDRRQVANEDATLLYFLEDGLGDVWTARNSSSGLFQNQLESSFGKLLFEFGEGGS